MENEMECLKIIRVKCETWIYLFIGMIVYCEAEKGKTRIYVCYGESYLVEGFLWEIIALINCKNFFSLGRRHFVNPDYFSELFNDGDGYNFCLGDEWEIFPAPCEGVEDFIKFIELSNKGYFFSGCLMKDKERRSYLAKVIRKPRQKAKGRRRWLWEWEKTGS